MGRKDNDQQPSKDGRAEVTPWKVLQRIMLGWEAAEWLDLEKSLLYLYHVAITEFRMTWRGEGWRFMVKGIRDGKPVVGYIHALSYRDGLEFSLWMLKEGNVRFKPDEYPVKF